MAQFATEDFKRPKLGRPQYNKRAEAFLEVATYLEDNDDKLITINDRTDLINQKLANTDYDANSYTYMKTRLHEHIGERRVQIKINCYNSYNYN